MKLKGSALNYAILLSLIVAVFILLIILLKKNEATLGLKEELRFTLLQNALSGVNYARYFENEEFINHQITLENVLFDTILVSSRNYGCFQGVTSIASRNRHKKTTHVLIGHKRNNSSTTNLAIPGDVKEISMAGKASITGKAIVPKNRIDRKSFYKAPPPHPDSISVNFIQLANHQFELPRHLRRHLTNLLKGHLGEYDSIRSDIETNTLYYNFSKMLVIKKEGVVSIEKDTIIGSVFICSDSLITIDSTTVIKDAILIAPRIHIKEGVKGSFQCVVSKELLVEQKSKLTYPSSLSAIPLHKDATPRILIDSLVTIEGVIINLSEKKTNLPSIRILQNSTVMGQIYCTGSLEIQGKVFGEIFCRRLLFNDLSGIHENIIYNGKISPIKPHQVFGGIDWQGKNPEMIIARWIQGN